MSPAHKKKSKKKKEENEESVSTLTTAQRWKGLALLALTALGSGMGEGAVKAIMESKRDVPTVSAPASPNKQDEKWNLSVPQQKDQPTGDAPKQHLNFIYTDYKGETQTFHTVASVQSLTNATFRWAANPAPVQPQPKQEGDETLVIKAQLHPSAPVITLNIPKKDIADQMATLGDSSISAQDLKSVKHIVISPYLNPEKPSKA